MIASKGGIFSGAQREESAAFDKPSLSKIATPIGANEEKLATPQNFRYRTQTGKNISEGTTFMASTPSKIGFTFAVSTLALSFSGVATAYEVGARRGVVDHQVAALSPNAALIPSVSLMQSSIRTTNYSPLLGANASYGVATEGAVAEGAVAAGAGGSGVIIAGLAAVLVVIATVSATSGDSVSA